MTAKPIYLDYQATTPVDPRVLEAMMPYFTEKFGNVHSINHSYGWQAEDAVATAREHVADAINASGKEIIFTSGATESNNLAIKGLAEYYKGKKSHLITVETEHECVRQSFRALEKQGWNVSWLAVNGDGLIDISQLRDLITEETLVVSVMAVNNEIGVIQPLEEIGRICKEAGVFFHTDAAQAFGKIPLNVQKCHIDLLSISAHKIYGPKGVGALYVRRRPRVGIEPLFSGGGQERNLRSGTLATPLIVGLGKATEIAMEEMVVESERLWALHKLLVDTLQKAHSFVALNGHATQRIPGNISLRFSGIDGDALLKKIKGLAVSSGSACSSASVAPSYVLQALGLTADEAKTTLRIGLGRMTTATEVDAAVNQLIHALNSLIKTPNLKQA